MILEIHTIKEENERYQQKNNIPQQSLTNIN